jgi:hypothetical protein
MAEKGIIKSPLSEEEARNNLEDLYAYRLIKFFNGNVRKAIKLARKEGVLPSLGEDPSCWQDAFERTRKRLDALSAEESLRQGTIMQQIVTEELAKYAAERGTKGSSS